MAKRTTKAATESSHDVAAQHARAADLRDLIGQLSRGEHPPRAGPKTLREMTDAAAREAAAKADSSSKSGKKPLKKQPPK